MRAHVSSDAACSATVGGENAFKPVALKLFALAAHFATFPNFATHLDQSADLFWFALSFPNFSLPDALWCITVHKGLKFLCNFL